MVSKIEFILAVTISGATLGIFLRIAGATITSTENGVFISSMFFIVPMIIILVLFRIYKSESPPSPRRKYSY